MEMLKFFLFLVIGVLVKGSDEDNLAPSGLESDAVADFLKNIVDEGSKYAPPPPAEGGHDSASDPHGSLNSDGERSKYPPPPPPPPPPAEGDHDSAKWEIMTSINNNNGMDKPDKPDTDKNKMGIPEAEEHYITLHKLKERLGNSLDSTGGRKLIENMDNLETLGENIKDSLENLVPREGIANRFDGISEAVDKLHNKINHLGEKVNIEHMDKLGQFAEGVKEGVENLMPSEKVVQDGFDKISERVDYFHNKIDDLGEKVKAEQLDDLGILAENIKEGLENLSPRAKKTIQDGVEKVSESVQNLHNKIDHLGEKVKAEYGTKVEHSIKNTADANHPPPSDGDAIKSIPGSDGVAEAEKDDAAPAAVKKIGPNGGVRKVVRKVPKETNGDGDKPVVVVGPDGRRMVKVKKPPTGGKTQKVVMRKVARRPAGSEPPAGAKVRRVVRVKRPTP